MILEGRNVFFAGQTGSGKTFAIQKWITDVPRLVVYLPKIEDHGYPGVYFNGREPGGFKAFCWWWYYANKKCRRFRIVYRPADKFDAEEFDRFCRLVYACGDCVFIAEEISSYLSSRIFMTVDRFKGIKNLLTAGRTRGVLAFWVTQRPFGIPREVTSESREAYLFHLQEPADLDYVQDRFGLAARLAIDRLKEYEHVHWLETGHVEVGKA